MLDRYLKSNIYTRNLAKLGTESQQTLNSLDWYKVYAKSKYQYCTTQFWTKLNKLQNRSHVQIVLTAPYPDLLWGPALLPKCFWKRILDWDIMTLFTLYNLNLKGNRINIQFHATTAVKIKAWICESVWERGPEWKCKYLI